MVEQEIIGIMPRPKIFITILVWVVSCICLLAIWQAPPQLSSSSLLSSSSSFSPSSSLRSEGTAHGEDALIRRMHRKPIRRTHVSNLRYLQKREKKSGVPPLVRSRPTEINPPKDNSYHRHKVKPYSKISFWERSSKGFSSSSGGSPESVGGKKDWRDAVAPLSDPISYHRSRIKDFMDSKDDSPTNFVEERDTKRLLGQHHKLETQSVKTPRDRGKRKNTQNNRNKKKKKWLENYELERAKGRDKNTDKNYDKNYVNEYDESGQGEEEEENYEDEYYEDEYEEYENEEGDEEVVYLGGRFNVTPPDATLLIYNRVPKCASSTMQTILRRLSRHLNFEHVSSLIYDHHQLTQDDQEKLLENLTASLAAAPSHALSYDRHLYYTNLTALGMSPPVYINIVRDPVERFISSFYYRRSEERLTRIQMHGKPVSPSLSWVNRTVEQCVLLNDTECTFMPGDEKETMLSYFCGHHKFCRIVGSRDAIQAAKQTVSKEYSVVGLVEHMDLSLLLLETLVPRFMEGALQIYENIRQKEHMAVNVNQQKPKVSLAMREELTRRMSDDLDFYYFLEQRLFEQKRNFLSQN